MAGWMDGWMGGWVGGWLGGWVGGCENGADHILALYPYLTFPSPSAACEKNISSRHAAENYTLVLFHLFYSLVLLFYSHLFYSHPNFAEDRDNSLTFTLIYHIIISSNIFTI